MHIQNYVADWQSKMHYSYIPEQQAKNGSVPTKEELQNFRGLKREIEDDRRRLLELANTSNVVGNRYSKASREYRRQIEYNIARCSIEYARLQAFINGIKDSTVRRIFTMYYIYGWQWQKIAFAIGAQTEAAPRLKLNRYLNSLYDK